MYTFLSVEHMLQSFLHIPWCAVLELLCWPDCRQSMSGLMYCTFYLCYKVSRYSYVHHRLCLAVIIALPAATPKEFMNTASFALGDFTNRTSAYDPPFLCSQYNVIPVNGWPNGYAFIMSFLAPLWTICMWKYLYPSQDLTNARLLRFKCAYF